MRVLFVSQVFAPEMGAAANRLTPVVRELVRGGHHVSVATGMPNYPRGVVHPEYQGKRFAREVQSGAHVFRTASYTAPRNLSKLSQLRSYLSFIPAAIHSGMRSGKADVVFVTSPPIFPVIAAGILARMNRARLVLDLRDLWPDEIVACGAAGDASAGVRLIRSIERWGYRNADCITCTTRPFMETVELRGASSEKLVLMPNGADLERFQPRSPSLSLCEKLGIGGRFVVMYSGLLGIKHGLDVILSAADLLRNHPEILFLLVGSGAEEEALRARAREMRLENVQFLGEQPAAEIPRFLSVADLCVSALRPEPYLEKIVSVKVFEYLACELPVVAAQSGETARILRTSGGGVTVAPGDAPALAAAIRDLQKDPARRRRMGREGRAFVKQHYSRGLWASHLREVLEALVSVEGRRPAEVVGRFPDAMGDSPAWVSGRVA